MSLLTTSAASIHQLAAAALVGPPPRPSIDALSSEREERVYPDGVCITAKGEVSPERAAGVDTYPGYFKVMGMLNRVFVAGAIATTPFINFALFNEYKPHPLRSFFAL